MGDTTCTSWDVSSASASCQEVFISQQECGVPCHSFECNLGYGGEGDGCSPPSLITTLIDMALSPGKVVNPMYEGQSGVQTALILFAFLSVPVMLLVKPLILNARMKEKAQYGTYAEGRRLVEDDGEDFHDDEEDHDEHSIGEIVIHQCIETIEFVLGMVSNTASYLRLWALSLAHAELSEVFWNKTIIEIGLSSGSSFMVFAMFGAWAGITFAVIICMDSLECFLHALRLHWVEFQNKFYKADGYKFTPFSYRKILDPEAQ